LLSFDCNTGTKNLQTVSHLPRSLFSLLDRATKSFSCGFVRWPGFDSGVNRALEPFPPCGIEFDFVLPLRALASHCENPSLIRLAS